MKLNCAQPATTSIATDWFLIPFFFLLVTCLIGYALCPTFGTSLIGDEIDTLQNWWSLSWFCKEFSAGLLHTLWYTRDLHYPQGASLIAHPLAPFNGLIFYILCFFCAPTSAYNVLIVASFVLSGGAMFALSRSFGFSRTASLAAGYFLTFSNYHFAHLRAGHLEFVTLQVLPLALLALRYFLLTPSVKTAILLSLSIIALTFTNFYYSACLFLSIPFFIVFYRKNVPLLFQREKIVSNLLLALGFLVPLTYVVCAFIQNARDPFIDSHPTAAYSLNPFELFSLPQGGPWFLNWVAGSAQSRDPALAEHDIAVGMGVLILAAYGILVARCRARLEIRLSLALLLGFFILSLGPEFGILSVPYTIVDRLLPLSKVSGAPIRFSVMCLLSSALIAAAAIDELIRRTWPWRVFAGFLVLVSILETLPFPLPTTNTTPYQYASALQKDPRQNLGVIDFGASSSRAMFHQTLHQKPIAFGYLARRQTSVAAQNKRILELLGAGEFETLCKSFRLGTLVESRDAVPANTKQLNILYQDRDSIVFDMCSPSLN